MLKNVLSNYIVKRTLIVLAVAAALMASGFYLTFRIITSAERLKSKFQSVLEKTLHRTVSVGEADFRFGKLVLKDIQIAFGPDDILRKDYESLLSCESMQLKFKILPIFKKKLVLKELVLDTPRLNFDGLPKLNIQTLSSCRLNMFLLGKGIFYGIKKLEIKGAALNLHRGELSGIHMKDIRVEIKSTSEEYFKIKAAAGFDKTGIEDVELAGAVDILRNTAELESMVIRAFGGRIDVSGSITEILQDPLFGLRYSVPDFPESLLHENIKVTGSPSVSGTLKGTFSNLFLEWDLDFSQCAFEYSDIYKKQEGDKLRFRGGIRHRTAYYDIDWYVIEMIPKTISGTGTIYNSEDIDLNVIGEGLDLGLLGMNISAIKKYISSGEIDVRGKFKFSADNTDFSAKARLSQLRLKNLGEISNLYKKISGNKKSEFLLEKVDVEVFSDNKKFTLKELKAEGGDIEGWGKGTIKWNRGLSFVIYPRIYGKEIGLRIYGTPDDVKVGLK